MKKLFTLLCAAVITFSISAQTHYGATLGINLSNITGNITLDDTGMKPGVRVGLSMKKEISSAATLHTGIIYSMKGATGQIGVEYYDSFLNYYYTEYVDADIALSYLEIPVNIGVAISDRFSLMGGFYSAFLLDATYTADGNSTSSTDGLATIDVGLGLGAEVSISENLSINTGYQMGLITIDDQGVGNAKNQSVLFGLTFNFGG